MCHASHCSFFLLLCATATALLVLTGVIRRVMGLRCVRGVVLHRLALWRALFSCFHKCKF